MYLLDYDGNERSVEAVVAGSFGEHLEITLPVTVKQIGKGTVCAEQWNVSGIVRVLIHYTGLTAFSTRCYRRCSLINNTCLAMKNSTEDHPCRRRVPTGSALAG